MSSKHPPVSTPPVTYSGQGEIRGATLTCTRCGRTYAFPKPGGKPIRCECGWWYSNLDGTIREEFRPRLGA